MVEGPLGRRARVSPGHWRHAEPAPKQKPAATRPDRELELVAVEAEIRKAQGSLDRYFKAFEEGMLREDLCTRRIEELSAQLTSLEARRSELVEEISESQPERPGPR